MPEKEMKMPMIIMVGKNQKHTGSFLQKLKVVNAILFTTILAAYAYEAMKKTGISENIKNWIKSKKED